MRPRQRDRGKALAGKSTLNRLELTPAGASRNEQIYEIAVACVAAAIRQALKLLAGIHRLPGGGR